MAVHARTLRQIQDLLHPEPLFVVGGSVRDRLLKRPLCDYDFVTAADPARAAARAADRLGGSAFVLDEERGVHRVSHPSGLQFDFAKRRGATIETDLSLRDFNLNAMAVPLPAWLSTNWKKGLIDPHGGLKDLKKKAVSAVSTRVIKDDPLRILRAFRIAAELHFSLPPKTARLLHRERKLLRRSAPERVREEILKLFSVPNAHPTLLLMEKARVWDVLYPEFAALRRTAPRYYGKGGVLKHTLDGIGHFEEVAARLPLWFPRCHKKIEAYLKEEYAGFPRSAHLKWSALLHDIGKPATAKIIEGRLRFFEHEHKGAEMVGKMAGRTRWSSEETKHHTRLVRHHMRPGNLATHEHLTDKAIHRFFRDLEDDAVGMLLIALGDHMTYLTPKERKRRNTPHERLTQRMVNAYFLKRKKVLPPRLINGHDIMKALNLTPSRLIGELLRDVAEAQSEGKVKTKEEGLQYLKSRLPQYANHPSA